MEKENKTYRVYCPELLIQDASEGDWLRSLALFCVMRNRFSAWFYDKQSAAEKLNIPISTFYRLIKPLEREGLVYHDGERYKLLKRKEIAKKYNSRHCSTLIITANDNLTKIVYKLRLKLVEKYARQQEYHNKVFKLIDSSKAGALKALKRLKRIHGDKSYDELRQQRIDKIGYEELLQQAGFTNEWLAEKLNCSKETARRTLQFGLRNNLCGIRTLTKAIKKMPYSQYKKQENSFRREFSSLTYKGGFACYNVCTLYACTNYWELLDKV